jgi:hypothetical protein
VIEGRNPVSFVNQSCDSDFSLHSFNLKTIFTNNLKKTVAILNEFDIYCSGSINNYSYLTGAPIVHATISEFCSKLNMYIISRISYIYLTSDPELISNGSYGFSVNDIKSTSQSKPSSLQHMHFYVNISNKDQVTIPETQYPSQSFEFFTLVQN